MIKGIFVDFYGTLVEEDGKIISEITKEIIKNTKIENIKENNISQYWWEQFSSLCNSSYENNFKRQREIEYISLNNTVNKFGSNINIENSLNKLFQYWQKPEIFNDTKHFLENIEMPIIILSNIDRDDISKAINYNKIIVNKIITSEDAKYYKPNEITFKYALEKCNLKPSEVIHIGDSLSSDICGASRAGIKTIWLNRNNKENKSQHKPSIIFNNLLKTTKYINSIK